ncbi:DCN1 1, partial [Paramuricea clavata]
MKESKTTVDKKKLQHLFERYKEPGDEDKIMAEGVGRFCEDLNLDPISIKVLLIAWKFKAATQCEFSRKEFTDGMTEIGCDSIDRLRSRLSLIENEISDTHKFKEFYQFTFNFAKNPGQKNL